MTHRNTKPRSGATRALLFAASLLVAGRAAGAVSPQLPLAAGKLPQFVDPLPLLSVQPGGTIATLPANGTSLTAPLQLTMCEFQANVLPTGTFVAGQKPATWVWGYVPGATCPTTPQDTYLGPVLVNTRNVPTTIKYTNQLPLVSTTNVLAYKYGTDQTMHWADPLGGEMNMCHMASGDPPAVGVGIPAFGSMCSENFGEDPRTVYNPVGIPAVPHLHGGEVPPAIDGGPDAWFTSVSGNGTVMKGHDYYTNPLVPAAANEAVYSYPNTQGQAPLWFHDHTLGATRLNVYAGLAGVYYLSDPVQEAWFQQIAMRPITEVVPVILQDRQFDTNGQLYFPQSFPGGINGPPLNPQHPYWNPEFLGDTIVVNGKAWPFLNVEPRRYRFLFLNGSNARTYETFLVNPVTKAFGPAMWVIGNDGGILDAPAKIDPAAVPAQHFTIMPGERYELVIDFSAYAGQTLVLKNVAKAPYPAGAAPQGGTTGKIMQFRVSATPVVDASYNPAAVPAVALRPAGTVRLASNGAVGAGVTVAKTRSLTLNEVALLAQAAIDPVTGVLTNYPGGPVEILVNNSTWMGKNRPDFKPVTLGGVTEYVSETPDEGTTEIWEIVNTTMDAHPIHTHLATFQILDRRNYDSAKYLAAYGLAFPGNGTTACAAGVYCPGFGPPYRYDELSARTGNKLGGNPDVTPFLQGLPQLPGTDEVGWKDTVMAPPGMVTRIVVRWAPTDFAATATNIGYPFSPNDSPTGAVGDSHGYVWHCHIIDHEDNEMMRQDVIVPNATVARTYVKGLNY